MGYDSPWRDPIVRTLSQEIFMVKIGAIEEITDGVD